MILDLQVEQMVFGRTILLGDAAFVPRPHTAGSTAKAAINALSLTQALHSAGTDIDTALADWQIRQLREGTHMTKWGIHIGNRIMDIPSGTPVLQAV